jgi:hypothetical protein
VIEVRKAAHGYAQHLIGSVMDTLEHKVIEIQYRMFPLMKQKK